MGDRPMMADCRVSVDGVAFNHKSEIINVKSREPPGYNPRALSEIQRGDVRTGADLDAASADRDAKIEQLLLVALDHYFAARYDHAINIWTRALFLDRNHARARAYIERARSALAEQQRESEELLHSGIAAFERGQIEAARELLNAAVQRGGAHEVALAFLTRIDRI